ncbi:unnamed protein product [Ceutorhynchus assimilis]|uniref:Centrosomal protein of 162 kDa n=1 Tax=Ceutorhynchus assimilis TaxID=467358 RepID=A0A9N9MPR1_9CUCU|nr:unnamed protein product [Ceutorhynchus assimilis]
METKKSSFWWMKTPQQKTSAPEERVARKPSIPKLDLKGIQPSASLTDILQKDTIDSDVDVGSIIEEINKVAAQSPLGPFEKSIGERSIDDIMKEAEKIYMESSKSFEQLSQRSKTSQNISDILSSNSKLSTPTPKSISPLPLDGADSSDYSEDFSEAESEKSYKSSSNLEKLYKAVEDIENRKTSSASSDNQKSSSPTSKIAKSISLAQNVLESPIQSPKESPYMSTKTSPAKTPDKPSTPLRKMSAEEQEDNEKMYDLKQEIEIRNKLITTLENDNGALRNDVQTLKLDLATTQALIEKLKSDLNTKTLSSPEINRELEKALEELKDSKEINTSLQLQLDNVNKSHQLLKSSYDDLQTSSKTLERKVLELDSTLDKYKAELFNMQQIKNKLLENEVSINKLLEIEKLQTKSLKLQNDKDSKCIQDLNRQIKEMERIIARKHPDSVSALIVAAKENCADTNLTARKLLEDRIKTLEQEVSNRDSHSSKVFLDIQDKFNQMKNKYESHIEDLELHVSDLKGQLKRKIDTYDVYTQTFFVEKIARKETFTIAIQTDAVVNKPKKIDNKNKDDAHLLATIRGLQADLTNKEKVIVKLQKEVEEMKKTNKRLQKEREGSLRNLSDRRDFRSYPEKLASHSRSDSVQDFRKEEELQQLKLERNRLKQQLARLEEDYQALKKKRLDDLTALQEAHEREISNYVSGVTPLREQLELQQVSIGTLQNQLTKTREELAVASVERDHLNKRMINSIQCGGSIMMDGSGDAMEVEALHKKISFLEKRYEEREYRLRAIVQSLAQKTISNRSCQQCAERQQQLIGYKVELDQLLATVRALK